MFTLCFDGLYRCLAEDCNADERGRFPAQAGVMCYGWLVYHNSSLIARGHGGYIRRVEASSNIAEYLALIEGLEALLDMAVQHEAVEIIGDARSVIDQMVGRAGVNSSSTRPLFRKAQRLARRFPRLVWTWTPRRKNRAADLLTRRAIKQIRANTEAYRAAVQSIERIGQPQREQKTLLPLLDLRIFQPAGMPL
jgi:ribonuclease HI